MDATITECASLRSTPHMIVDTSHARDSRELHQQLATFFANSTNHDAVVLLKNTHNTSSANFITMLNMLSPLGSLQHAGASAATHNSTVVLTMEIPMSIPTTVSTTKVRGHAALARLLQVWYCRLSKAIHLFSFAAWVTSSFVSCRTGTILSSLQCNTKNRTSRNWQQATKLCGKTT